MYLDEFPAWFLIVALVSIGLCFGSFLNVVIYRLPRELNLAHPPSACPACGKPIAAYDNVPVLGWLWLRGRARCCGVAISPRYPLVEMLGGLLAWAVLEMRVFPFVHDFTIGHALAVFALFFALGLALVALAFIDLEFMVLPDSLTLGGTALGVVSTFVRDDLDWMTSLGGAVGGFVLIWLPFIWAHQKLRGFPGMGLGDAKLAALAGAWFGPFGVVFTLFAGALQGTVAALVILLVRGKIEEPEAVRAELDELRRAIEEAEGEERAELEAALAADPLGRDAEEGFGGARIAFGPFLALACLELVLIEPWLRVLWNEWFEGAFV